MRAFILIAAVSLSGCASIGELEVLNDVGLSKEREVISTYNKTLNVLGVQSKTRQAARANRAYGHAKNMRVEPKSVNDVPYVVRDLKELERYLRALP